jgi:hypothetical protein
MTKFNRAVGVAATFCASAAFSFVLTAPNLASSASVRTVSGAGCRYTTASHMFCSIPIGADYPTSRLTYGYLHANVLTADHAPTASFSFVKVSYAGSYASDYVQQTLLGPGAIEMWVPAVNVKVNSNSYDYLSGEGYFSPGSTGTFIGVAVR